MKSRNPFSDEYIRRYLNGSLSDEETFAFKKQMEEDPLLYEEVTLLEAMIEVERDSYIGEITDKVDAILNQEEAAPVPEQQERVQVAASRSRSWLLRLAASITLALGLAWLLWSKLSPEKTSFITAIPVRESTDNSLGWAESPSEARVAALFTRDESGILRYSFSNDTLKIFTPTPLKSLSGKDKVYLLDDLRNRRLLLVIDGKKYEVESGIEEVIPLVETE